MRGAGGSGLCGEGGARDEKTRGADTSPSPFPFPSSADSFVEGKGEIEFPEISTAVLEKVIQYMHYKVSSRTSRTGGPIVILPPLTPPHPRSSPSLPPPATTTRPQVKYHNSKVPIPEFPIAPEMALELLTAANYLDV